VIVAQHRGDHGPVRRAVDEHGRQAAGGDLLQQRVLTTSGRQNEAVDPPCSHRIENGPLLLVIVVGIGQYECPSAVAESTLDATHDRWEERVGQIGDEHADGERPTHHNPGP
jgi:hypothetical protein